MSVAIDWPTNVDFVDEGSAGNAGNAGRDKDKTAFPLTALPTCLRECVEDCVRVYGVEPDLPAMIGLSIIAAAIGKGVEIDSRGYRIRGNLFCLASAPSGAGKSSCFRPFAHPLHAIEEQLMVGFSDMLPKWEAERDLLEAESARLKRGKGDLSDKAERMAEIKARLQTLEQLSRPPQLIAENVTVEALSVLLEGNDETIAMLSPDGSEVITNWLGRYNKTDRTDEGLLLKAWTGEPCRINRLSRKPVCLRQPCLSVLLCCTPDEVRNLFANERFVMGGLMPRFLVCESRSRPKERNGETLGLDKPRWESWNSLINLIYHATEPDARCATVYMDAKAQAIFDKAHNRYCRSFDHRPEGDSFEARRVEQAMRIALCLHVLRFDECFAQEHIDEHSATAALQLADYFGQTASREQEAALRRRDEEMMERITETSIRYGTETKKGRVVSVREVKRRNNLDTEQLDALISRNTELLEITKVASGDKGGQPYNAILLKRILP